eukprot:12312191-Karenia_brevis.AAC.1
MSHDEVNEALKQRKEKVANVLKMFTGDPRDKDRFDHHCPGYPLCGSNQHECASLAYDAWLELVKVRLVIPALNKWLQVAPTIAFFTLIMSAHELFNQAWQATCSSNTLDDGSDTSE